MIMFFLYVCLQSLLFLCSVCVVMGVCLQLLGLLMAELLLFPHAHEEGERRREEKSKMCYFCVCFQSLLLLCGDGCVTS